MPLNLENHMSLVVILNILQEANVSSERIEETMKKRIANDYDFSQPLTSENIINFLKEEKISENIIEKIVLKVLLEKKVLSASQVRDELKLTTGAYHSLLKASNHLNPFYTFSASNNRKTMLFLKEDVEELKKIRNKKNKK
ncbi:hypothetical protein [Alkalibacterium sp. 20]|uniref:hypothetical protein n=1 Tax=Alkalibacterium sp. 20 TaxID=1798803 RepID=UPI0009000EAC|nr:hypothetical protein [Alkalibacterium sp. 20]OJF96190.1 hypothetical protein AX762_05505 [Alkalibacterium sp. 20]